MNLGRKLSSMGIIKSFGILKGNTRTSVMFEPLWGVPFMLFNFYLSLYMKETGVTDLQIGYIISIGYIAGTVFSLFGGVITDRVGRKKTTLIFDFISWPVSLAIYVVSNSFWLFALATVTNNFIKISSVSWNLMVVEDSDNEERVAAFNLMNIINIASGIVIPLAGVLVSACGVVISERIFLIFAFVSMSAMILLRNHFYRETAVGRDLLQEHRKNPVGNSIKTVLPSKAAAVYSKKPEAIMAIAVFVLLNIIVPLGSMSSLFFAPYMTEVLRLSKSVISVLGGVNAAIMLVIFAFVVPRINRYNNIYLMIVGLVIQGVSLFLLIVIPAGDLVLTIMCIALYSVGLGIFRPYIDSLLARVTEGNDRAGIYAIVNTLICVLTAALGFVSGSMYLLNPRLIYITSVIILAAAVVILAAFLRYEGKHRASASSSPEMNK